MGNRICKNCYSDLREDAEFCSKCGKKCEKDKYDVILVGYGDSKINVIKAVKDACGMDLREAMEFVESAPNVIKKGISEDEAKAYKKALEGAGATIEVQPFICSGENHTEVKNLAWVQLDNPANINDNDSNAPRCPNCGSRNLSAFSENTTDVSGGGYGFGKGCCGWILLGPLGLMCGLCGQKVKLKSINRLYWICKECGYKDRDKNDAMEETNSFLNFLLLRIGIICLIAVVLGFMGSPESWIFRLIGIPPWLFVVGGIAVFVASVVIISKIKKMI